MIISSDHFSCLPQLKTSYTCQFLTTQKFRHEKFHSFAKDLAAFTVKLEQYSISVQVKHTLQNLTKITTTLQFVPSIS